MKKATVPISEEAVVFLSGWEVQPRFQPVLNLTGRFGMPWSWNLHDSLTKRHCAHHGSSENHIIFLIQPSGAFSSPFCIPVRSERSLPSIGPISAIPDGTLMDPPS